MICHKSDSNTIDTVVSILKQNKVAILPTDTVYGFSGIVTSDSKTDCRIREIKGRAENKPFIQLIATPDEILKYTNKKLPEELLSYWPGPLTVIVEDCRLKDNEINTTAFRCPGDEWLRTVILKLGAPIYSTSVNRSGFPVLDREEDIIKEFESETDLIVLDGDKLSGIPSTIVKFEEDNIKVLRQGSLVIKNLN